ncbi:unnamed protein product [Calicophoron daubneyi]|uniref:E3 ubiquitin-protein ligase CBL n=1 Tax=Calicophoron daubneyi TaxID=300641 RepID=A0AAV2TUL9_CALDB
MTSSATVSGKNLFSNWDRGSKSLICTGNSTSSNGSSDGNSSGSSSSSSLSTESLPGPWTVGNRTHLNTEAVDRKTVESCYKWLDRVVRLCEQPRLNLKNSPPYLLDITPDIYDRLQSIVNHYKNNYETLMQIDYFRVYVSTLIEKCKRVTKVFKEAREKIFDPHSHARFRLTKLSLVFSHLLKDLEALFPDGQFCGSTFRITKPDAAKWWSANFGDQLIVSWPVFQAGLLHSFHVDSNGQLLALRNTIDLTCNKYVSIFEFDVFTRLFQPWRNILETWKALAVLHPGYMAFMTYDEVKAVLRPLRNDPGPGSYVFRLSCTKLGQWAIGYITKDLKILQTIIQNKSLAQALLDGEREGFYLYPNGKRSMSNLLYQLVHNLPQVHLQVTQEQYEVYCDMGSTFELCKICDANNKDVQLEPCGHLICRNCLLSCQSTGHNQTCPFCRLEIKGIEDVVVDPYQPAENNAYRTSKSPVNDKTPQNENPPLSGPVRIDPLGFSSSTQGPLSKSCNLTPALSQTNFTTHRQSLTKPPPVPPRNPCAATSLLIETISKRDDCGRSSETIRPTHSECARNSHTSQSSDVQSCALSTSAVLHVNTSGHVTSICSYSRVNGRPCLCVNNFAYDSSSARPPSCMPCSLSTPSQATESKPFATRTDLSASTVLPSAIGRPNATDLNYAQLELTYSDSENDRIVMDTCSLPLRMTTSCDISSIASTSPSTKSSTCDPKTSTLSYASADSNSRSQTLKDHKRPLVLEPPQKHSTKPVQETLDSHIIYLRSIHADMSEEEAKLLLSITQDQPQMASQIWTYFMPRPNRCQL